MSNKVERPYVFLGNTCSVYTRHLQALLQLFLIFRHSSYNMHQCHNCPSTSLFVIFMVSFYEHKLLFLLKYFLPLLQLKVHSKIEQKLEIPSGGIFHAP